MLKNEWHKAARKPPLPKYDEGPGYRYVGRGKYGTAGNYRPFREWPKGRKVDLRTREATEWYIDFLAVEMVRLAKMKLMQTRKYRRFKRAFELHRQRLEAME